jgi:two-component sensor histidine kinase
MKILINECSEETFGLVYRLLDHFHEKPDVRRVETFEATIAALEAETFDVCLLDYALGNHTAIDVLAYKHLTIENTPFIILLAAHDHDIDQLVLQQGASDSLAKDELSEILLERSIRYAMHRKQFQIAQAEFAKEREILMKERELLLKEVEHRVKNNLQVVAGLLSWEGNEAGNAEVRKVLHEAQNRIQTMMLIHEKLYQSNRSLDQIDFSVYAPELIELILQSYGLKAPNVNVRYEMPYSILDLTKAVPCSLILTELVSNCLTHGYGNSPENILLILKMRKYHNHLHMVLQDNGTGLIELESRKNSFGLRMITLLISQLKAKIRFVNRDGLAVHIRFPE